MLADLTWIAHEAGGRQLPPSGTGPYTTIVRLLDANEAWPAPVAWSLVIERERVVGDEFHWIAAVQFLAAEAPHEAMRPGGRFELYEGDRCVAVGHFVKELTSSKTELATLSGKA
jgi:hypothetical protein